MGGRLCVDPVSPRISFGVLTLMEQVMKFSRWDTQAANSKNKSASLAKSDSHRMGACCSFYHRHG